MKINTIALLPLACLAQTLQGATSFTEDFNSTTITSHLTAQATWRYGSNSTPAGSAQQTSGIRTYITTTDTDYNGVDFTAQTIVTTLRGSGGAGIIFFGFGPGTPTGTYGEPGGSYYLRVGASDFSFIDATNGPTSGNYSLASSSPDGTYMLQIQKIGNNVTFGLEQNYTSGAFVATPGLFITETMTGGLSFLNSANSKLFIGTQSTKSTFDSFSVVTAVPETSALALLALSACGIGLRRRRLD